MTANQLNKRRELIQAAKDRPCVDCGICYPQAAMDLDHRDGELKESRGSFIRWAKSVGLDRLQKEIAKCDVRCANCHRMRHFAGEVKVA